MRTERRHSLHVGFFLKEFVHQLRMLDFVLAFLSSPISEAMGDLGDSFEEKRRDHFGTCWGSVPILSYGDEEERSVSLLDSGEKKQQIAFTTYECMPVSWVVFGILDLLTEHTQQSVKRDRLLRWKIQAWLLCCRASSSVRIGRSLIMLARHQQQKGDVRRTKEC